MDRFFDPVFVHILLLTSGIEKIVQGRQSRCLSFDPRRIAKSHERLEVAICNRFEVQLALGNEHAYWYPFTSKAAVAITFDGTVFRIGSRKILRCVRKLESHSE